MKPGHRTAEDGIGMVSREAIRVARGVDWEEILTTGPLPIPLFLLQVVVDGGWCGRGKERVSISHPFIGIQWGPGIFGWI